MPITAQTLLLGPTQGNAKQLTQIALRLVQGRMLRLGHDLEVLRGVVPSIAVDVMNDFIPRKQPAKRGFSNQSMLCNIAIEIRPWMLRPFQINIPTGHGTVRCSDLLCSFQRYPETSEGAKPSGRTFGVKRRAANSTWPHIASRKNEPPSGYGRALFGTVRLLRQDAWRVSGEELAAFSARLDRACKDGCLTSAESLALDGAKPRRRRMGRFDAEWLGAKAADDLNWDRLGRHFWNLHNRFRGAVPLGVCAPQGFSRGSILP